MPICNSSEYINLFQLPFIVWFTYFTCGERTHVLDGSDAVQSLFLPGDGVTVVGEGQEVCVVAEVQLQLVVMTMSSHHVNHLGIDWWSYM